MKARLPPTWIADSAASASVRAATVYVTAAPTSAFAAEHSIAVIFTCVATSHVRSTVADVESALHTTVDPALPTAVAVPATEPAAVQSGVAGVPIVPVVQQMRPLAVDFGNTTVPPACTTTQPGTSTQRFSVASHADPAPQSPAPSAHTVAASSPAAGQQQRRALLLSDASHVVEGALESEK